MSFQPKPKKHLGQHFLTDHSIAQKIANTLTFSGYTNVLEIGPGKGILTEYLRQKPNCNFKCIELDSESVEYLRVVKQINENELIEGDFLKIDLHSLFQGEFCIAGNFPYNISSQILFRALEHTDLVPELVGMFQLEVAQRIAAAPGSKTYGILSVLCQCKYEVTIVFTVNPGVFFPPPKVMSAVIILKRLSVPKITTDFQFFKTVVKTAFNQRRKMLRNSLLSLNMSIEGINPKFLTLRPEQLSVDDFDQLCQSLLSPKK